MKWGQQIVCSIVFESPSTASCDIVDRGVRCWENGSNEVTRSADSFFAVFESCPKLEVVVGYSNNSTGEESMQTIPRNCDSRPYDDGQMVSRFILRLTLTTGGAS